MATHITVAQALATVLNVQIVESPVQGAPKMYIKRADSGAEIVLGSLATTSLHQAVYKAVQLAHFDEDCKFAIVPMQSERAVYYMEIERELIAQEAHAGHPLYTQLGADPREFITLIMSQLRECAVHIIAPNLIRVSMLRVGCLILASLQWIDAWIHTITDRHQQVQQQSPQEPEPVPFEEPETAKITVPIPPLFGVQGVPAAVPELKETPEKEIKFCKTCKVDCTNNFWMCDEAVGDVWCPACFEFTDCGQGAHAEGCPTHAVITTKQ